MINEHDKILLYRISHIDNLEYILDLGKLTSPNHESKDENYIGIGDSTLIQNRSSKSIDIEPFGTFTDYVSFYFTNRSPMLYNIYHGFNKVIKRNQEEIIYFVTNYKQITDNQNKFVYFDGHGYHHLSNCFNEDNGLSEIDWDVIHDIKWADTDEDSDRKRRKQAELLVYHELPINQLIGIGVYNQQALEKISELLNKKSVNLKCKIKRKWYY